MKNNNHSFVINYLKKMKLILYSLYFFKKKIVFGIKKSITSLKKKNFSYKKN